VFEEDVDWTNLANKNTLETTAGKTPNFGTCLDNIAVSFCASSCSVMPLYASQAPVSYRYVLIEHNRPAFPTLLWTRNTSGLKYTDGAHNGVWKIK